MITLETRIGPNHEYVTTPSFEAMHFPAGEAHIKRINENEGKGKLTEIAIVTTPTADDLVTLAMWADTVSRDSVRKSRPVVLLPYLPGARQDRGQPFGAMVYATVMDLWTIEVICFDAHSPVMSELMKATVVPSTRLIRSHVVGRADSDQKPQAYAGIIAPDKGAVKRAQAVADACHLPLYKAEKHRDPSTGKLSGFSCETLPESDKPYLVVDDICDGGGTFMGLAGSTGLPADKLHLFVSHGVFSKGSERLSEHFGKIITTNSYKPQTEIPNLEILDIFPYLYGAIK